MECRGTSPFWLQRRLFKPKRFLKAEVKAVPKAKPKANQNLVGKAAERAPDSKTQEKSVVRMSDGELNFQILVAALNRKQCSFILLVAALNPKQCGILGAAVPFRGMKYLKLACSTLKALCSKDVLGVQGQVGLDSYPMIWVITC